MESINHSQFFDYIGFKREDDTKEQIVLSITVKDHLLSDQQFIASGVFATMLDIGIGTAITNVSHCPAATIQLNLSYFNLTRRNSFTCKANFTHKEGNLASGEGDIFAEAKILQQGHNLVFAEGEIKDSKGTVITKGIGIFKLIRDE